MRSKFESHWKDFRLGCLRLSLQLERQPLSCSECFHDLVIGCICCFAVHHCPVKSPECSLQPRAVIVAQKQSMENKETAVCEARKLLSAFSNLFEKLFNLLTD